MFAFHANAPNQPKSSASKKKSKELKSKEAKKERKEPDHVKVNSSKLTCEQIREMINFGDEDSDERRALQLAAQATLPKVVTLSLRFKSESGDNAPIDDSASESGREQPDKPKDRRALVLTGASIVALDDTVTLVLDQIDGRAGLLAETIIAGAASLLGIDCTLLDESCYLHTGAAIRENQDLSRPFGVLNDRCELQFRPFPQCDLCMMPIRSHKGSTVLCDHKFNGHVLAACTAGGCIGTRDFNLPSGTLTVFRDEGSLEAAFAPTGQKPARLTADFVTPDLRISSRAQSPDDTEDESEVVTLSDDEDKPIVADPKKRKLEHLEHRLTHPAKKAAHHQPQAQLTKNAPQTKVMNFPSVTEPEPEPEPEPKAQQKVPKAPEQKEQPKEQPKETKAPEPTGTNVAQEHADLAKLIKALFAAMSVNDACNVIATVAAFWHNGPPALGPCIQSLVALKCSSDAIALVAINWPR
jgi:hypothetical protein